MSWTFADDPIFTMNSTLTLELGVVSDSVVVAPADPPECGSGSCANERRAPGVKRSVSFPPSPFGRSVKTNRKRCSVHVTTSSEHHV